MHKSAGHKKRAATWNECRKKYYNVTQELVNAYIDLCPVCNQQQPIIQARRGAAKPIVSHQFRDRFQVDLIDMRTKRKKNIHGVLMRWIMTVKDHSTGLTYLAALPKKQPQFVAHELDLLFGFIGYPSIFHTDNGGELLYGTTSHKGAKGNKSLHPNRHRTTSEAK